MQPKTQEAFIDIAPTHLAILLPILAQHLPASAMVYVFGSRARGRSHRGSDLDLAIDMQMPIPKATKQALSFAIEDSDLPYKVDIADLQTLKEPFRSIITPDLLPLAW